jgi:short-subunit dehydrogenase
MNKTALITGASNGIGYELASIHAEHGDDLIVVARTKCKLDVLKTTLEKRFGIKVLTIEKDLSVPGAAEEVYHEINSRNITVDFLVNNAGFGDISLFAESDWTRQERMINLNVMALTHLSRLILPDMISRKSGKILNVASTASFQPGPTMAVYFATKSYVLSFSEAINNELKEHGVTVTALCPGSTESGFHAAANGEGRHIKERKLPSAREVAEFGYKSMMKGKAVAIPGIMNSIMATSVRFIPRSIVVKAARKIQENKH